MAVKIKLLYQLIFLFIGLAFAFGTGLILFNILSGPRLGGHYDFLLDLKKTAAVSPEILIINTEDIIETNDKFLVLMTLAQMGGKTLVVTEKEALFSSPLTVNEAEIRRRFSDEYFLIGMNIRNLFEAIRLGSVSPVQAPHFVDMLVELTEQGRDRLLAALIDRNEILMRAISVFGNYIEAVDSPQYDFDGKLRRVQHFNPDDSAEHPVFAMLKHRYADSGIESADGRKILWLKKYDESEFNITLDNNGKIIIPQNVKFRSIDVSIFLEYDEALRIMREVLVYGDGLGAFSQTMPEQSPLFLEDYSLILMEEMLNNPNNENRASWLKSRNDYFKSLDDFVNGNAEALIVQSYNNIIREEGLDALIQMRDELIQSFVFIRAQYEILQNLRITLEQEVNESFCIMGTADNTKYSALLANAVITGNHTIPAGNIFVILWSSLAVFIIISGVFWLKPFIQLLTGLGLCVISLILFCGIFIYFSVWIDPLIAFGSGVSGTLAVFFSKLIFLNHRKFKFRAAFGSAVSDKMLNELIIRGKPHPAKKSESVAAVVAIKDVNLLRKEEQEKPQEAGELKKAFIASVKESVFDAGGIIAGFEGDTILACFGSPLDNTENPVNKAYSFVKHLIDIDKKTWRFGIDAGNCTFYWSKETGFSVHGRPAVLARMLASRTARFKVRALITDHIRDKLNLQITRIDLLFENSEPIFDLLS